MRLPFTHHKRKFNRKSIRTPKPPLEKIFERALIRRARDDPEWAFQAAAQQAGITVAETDIIQKAKDKAIASAFATDPEFADAAKKEYLESRETAGIAEAIDAEVDEATLKALQDDPALMHRAIERRLSQTVGDGAKGSSPLSAFLEELEEFDSIRERLGQGESKGGLAGLLTPEVVQSIFESLPSLLGKGQRPVYVVETPEGIVEMGAGEYQKYLGQRKQPPSLPPSKDSVSPAQAPPPASISALPLKAWLPYLDGEPALFLEALRASEDVYAKVALVLLQTKTANDLLAMLQPYKEDPEMKPVIERLETQQDWLEKVSILARGES
mgnify:CR=1 FL=1